MIFCTTCSLQISEMGSVPAVHLLGVWTTGQTGATCDTCVCQSPHSNTITGTRRPPLRLGRLIGQCDGSPKINLIIVMLHTCSLLWILMTPENNVMHICRSPRWAAYRQFTWWVYGRLDRRVRRVIPACASHRIRTQLPEQEGHEGHHCGLED